YSEEDETLVIKLPTKRDAPKPAPPTRPISIRMKAPNPRAKPPASRPTRGLSSRQLERIIETNQRTLDERANEPAADLVTNMTPEQRATRARQIRQTQKDDINTLLYFILVQDLF
ncbi:MAG: hypothetical protein V2I33_24870, partial [Kangiellaceae bacterium]|nr:hypothetical protein [Kangiellaceae bacterium]